MCKVPDMPDPKDPAPPPPPPEESAAFKQGSPEMTTFSRSRRKSGRNRLRIDRDKSSRGY